MKWLHPLIPKIIKKCYPNWTNNIAIERCNSPSGSSFSEVSRYFKYQLTFWFEFFRSF